MSSHLKEASSSNIDHLFAKDPVELTDEEVDQICDKLEASAKLWSQKENKDTAPATVDVADILDSIPD